MNDEQAVASTASGVDVMTAHRPVLEAFLHDFEDLLRRGHLCTETQAERSEKAEQHPSRAASA